MTIIKHGPLVGKVLLSLVAGLASYAVMRTFHERWGLDASVNHVILGLVLAVAVLTLFVFRQNFYKTIAQICSQLREMSRSGRVHLMGPYSVGQSAQITRSLNEFLDSVKTQIERLESENRELQLQCRVISGEKRNTEAIIFSISDAVIVTNRFDELLLANEAAENLLGFTFSRDYRLNIAEVISDKELVDLICEVRSHGEHVTRRQVEHTITVNGASRTFNTTFGCVVTPDDEISGVVAVLHDITHDKEIADMKTNFVSHVSHELKTPLASIKAYIEMLLDGEAQDKQTQRDFYEIISAETNRLHRLIENILNISRIESGVIKVARKPMSITGVVKQVLDVVCVQAKAKNIKIEQSLAPVFYQVQADQDLVYQAVMNLVSNAIKYTPRGGKVTVTVAVDERRRVVRCEVGDSGVGIPPQELPHVFDKFYRVGSNEKVAKGTGLGLTLVKRIIETVHNGKLDVASEEGKESTFAFELALTK